MVPHIRTLDFMMSLYEIARVQLEELRRHRKWKCERVLRYLPPILVEHEIDLDLWVVVV